MNFKNDCDYDLTVLLFYLDQEILNIFTRKNFWWFSIYEKNKQERHLKY